MTAISSIFRETSTAIGKIEIREHHESIYSMGFLSLMIVTIVFVAIAFIDEGGIHIHPDSYGLLGARIGLDIVGTYLSLVAIKKATRSTMSFFRLITVPLILIVDVIIGYTISVASFFGMGIVLVGLGFLFFSHGTSRKGIGWVLAQATLATATFSLFKYNIDTYNTIASEQAVATMVMLVVAFIMAFVVRREGFREIIWKKSHLGQSFLAAISSTLASFAFNFASPSVLVTVKRGSDIIASVISGNMVFHEKHLAKKLTALAVVIGGLVLLALG